MPKNQNSEDSDQTNEDAPSNKQGINPSGKEALSLFEEQEKREARKSKKREPGISANKVGGILPPIYIFIYDDTA